MGSKESVIKIPAPPSLPPPHRGQNRENVLDRSWKFPFLLQRSPIFFQPIEKKKKEGEEKPPTQRGQIAFSNESHVEMFEIVSFSNGK